MSREKAEKVLKKRVSKVKSKDIVFAVGRRKTAVARIRLFHGRGETLVNGIPIEKYFPGEANKTVYSGPFLAANAGGSHYAHIKVGGSGKYGQLWAVVLGLARALDKENRELYHSSLKKSDFLTRDPRAKERRKVGQMGKARKKKQSPKR